MKIKKRTLRLALLLLAALIASVFLFKLSETYTIHDGLFAYSKNRPTPDFEVLSVNNSGNYTVTDITLQSRDAKLSAYYLESKKNAKAGIVLIPGAGVGKQPELAFAKMLAEEGFSVITYDQRGIGNTIVEKTTSEPETHKAVYDALAAFDFLRKTKKMQDVAIIGESLGGRTAVIAASMDSRIYGVLAISTSGYGPVTDQFHYSVNPDNYIKALTGRKIAFIHSTFDDVIPPELARQTFQLASPPKRFLEIHYCGHGYCEEMKGEVLDALSWVSG